MENFNIYVSQAIVDEVREYIVSKLNSGYPITFNKVVKHFKKRNIKLEIAVAWKDIMGIDVGVDKLHKKRVNRIKFGFVCAVVKCLLMSRFIFSLSLMLGSFYINGITWRGFIVYLLSLYITPYVYVVLMSVRNSLYRI